MRGPDGIVRETEEKVGRPQISEIGGNRRSCGPHVREKGSEGGGTAAASQEEGEGEEKRRCGGGGGAGCRAEGGRKERTRLERGGESS
jgi:hypothetical protein